MRLIDADVLKQHIDKLPALPDGNFAGSHSALKALINMQPTVQPEERTEKRTQSHGVCLGTISRQATVELAMQYCPDDDGAVQCDGDIRELLDELENLPPAQPERKKGRWIQYDEDTLQGGLMSAT